MSVLEAPRFYFKGEVTWDPIVTNNDADRYDEARAEPVFSVASDRVAAFRRRAIDDVASGRNWNPHGTHRATFYNCAVTGFDVGVGEGTNDPFVGASAWLTGMLVDLEPYGGLSSQIFFDRVSFGVEGGYSLSAARRTRFTARYINFARNNANAMIAGVASVVWQTSFAKTDGLAVGAHDSGILQALQSALEHDDVLGLTLRFNAYRTVYFGDPALRTGSPASQAASAALAAKLSAGGFQPNPARSLIVGVVGLWRKGEATSEPGERLLRPSANSPLAGAFARADERRLTLDLANSIPEADTNLTKLDLGPLTVAAVDAAGRDVAVIGALPYAQYDRIAYERAAGIVTLPLTPETAAAARENDLVLRNATGTVLAVEARLRAIPDTPNLYRDEGQPITAQFQVYERGIPLRRVVSVEVYTMNADGSSAGTTQTLPTDAAGRLQAPVPASGGGILALVPSVEGADPAPIRKINPQVNTYMYIRTLPADSDVAALAPTWDNVFARVLANWAAMAPCMDNWLPLQDATEVKFRANLLKRLTDPGRFEEFRFMPVTRDMTAGERTLLHKFLDAPAPAVIAAAPAEVQDTNFVELSQSMRRGPLR